ncbi:MAG: hypothetical protein ACKPKO_23450, partial [Candidatus Fonsibacter sp.]
MPFKLETGLLGTDGEDDHVQTASLSGLETDEEALAPSRPSKLAKVGASSMPQDGEATSVAHCVLEQLHDVGVSRVLQRTTSSDRT